MKPSDFGALNLRRILLRNSKPEEIADFGFFRLFNVNLTMPLRIPKMKKPSKPTCLVMDVHYQEQGAQAAGILFQGWDSDTEHSNYCVTIEQVADYQPGQFYLRELPCLLAVIEQIAEPIDFIIIDGYVTLGEDSKAGLGMHLWHALEKHIPIIGVAKSSFHNTDDKAQLIRGNSLKPLFISAVGVELESAKSYIQQMHGDYRLPTLLKKVDTLCRLHD